MADRSKKLNIFIILGAALLIVALIALVIVQSHRLSASQGIVLPDASASQQTQTSPQAGLAEVTRENVSRVLRTMARSTAYHQVLEILTQTDTHTRTQTAEVWVSGNTLRAQLEENNEIRNVLTDGQTLYVWYNGESEAISLGMDGTISSDDLVGIPTHEQILDIPTEQILDASFVTLAELGDMPCIFISTMENGLENHYWVSLATGLLCRQTAVDKDDIVYSLTQVSVELLAEGDSVFADIFVLPDGKTPFITEE